MKKRIVLFDDVLSSFLEDKKTRSRSSTYIGYESVIRNYILPFFAGKDVFSIKPLTVREWQNGIISSRLSPMYIRRIDTFRCSCRLPHCKCRRRHSRTQELR